jgi:hypothetical protein
MVLVDDYLACCPVRKITAMTQTPIHNKERGFQGGFISSTAHWNFPLLLILKKA